jgi:hypothetical protein
MLYDAPGFHGDESSYSGLLGSTSYCYGMVSHKASHTLRLFPDLLCVTLRVIIAPDASTIALWQIPAETPSSEPGKLNEKW